MIESLEEAPCQRDTPPQLPCLPSEKIEWVIESCCPSWSASWSSHITYASHLRTTAVETIARLRAQRRTTRWHFRLVKRTTAVTEEVIDETDTYFYGVT